MNADRARRILESAAKSGRRVLLETQALAVVEAVGIPVPRHIYIRGSSEVMASDLSPFACERVVVKVMLPDVIHKSDIGGVEIVPNDRAAIRAAVSAMEGRFRGQPVDGYTIHQHVDYDHSFGGELLLGMRWTEDFGSVVVLAPGGLYADLLAADLREGRDIAVLSPADAGRRSITGILRRGAAARLLTRELRGRPPRLPLDDLVAVVENFLSFAASLPPGHVTDFEVNPLVVSGGRLCALDAVLRLGDVRAPSPPSRPLEKMKQLLEPRSVALVGVSARMNPGRVILGNLLREGFPAESIFVVKPGSKEIDGCRCVPDLASLPSVDLTVLSIGADAAASAVIDLVAGRKTESIIVIPGGLEEKEGTDALVGAMRSAVTESRSQDWRGPLVVGGNSLGIRSRPGRYDTLFIPAYKLGAPQGRPSPLALISQSGAFAIARNSKFFTLNPKYVITYGNQMDLTLGDYLAHLKDDSDVAVYAVYAEGFQPLDGARFLETAADIVAGGRTVVLYKAGRTEAGARASASHTASVAGDYAVARELARNAGVIVAPTLEDFEDLVMLFTLLAGRSPRGWRLGAVSNAGFENVVMADSAGDFELASFSPQTENVIRRVFDEARIESIVDVHNPLDLTPMTADAPYESAVRAVLDDPGVDIAVVGCVPLTPALATLPPGPDHAEDLHSENSIASRLARVATASSKPWVAVVDSGPLYDPMARMLLSRGLPTFRTADRAVRLLGVFCRTRLDPADPEALR